MKFEKIDEYDEVLEFLGFLERKVFQYENSKILKKDEILLKILESDIFFKRSNYRKGGKIYEKRANHALTDKITIFDFDELSYHELEERIGEIEKEENWGEDLPIFQELIGKSKYWIISNNLQNEDIFFINQETVDEEKLIDYNYYSYFLSLVIISESQSRVVIVNHGGD